ncbi:MAG TPA: SpoIIE family protein phosphatase [Tepidisphaeraceae bacterium]|nr:SpoIIE family protein phosphatase [Tepidisphaeraceae bacterium]
MSVTAPTLEVRDANGALLRFPLDRPTLILGRGADADVRLDHGMVSRQHCQFTRDDAGHWAVKDMGSRNGTTVNGVPVNGDRAIGPGDRIVVGPFACTLHLPATERPAHQTTRIPVADLGGGGRISTFNDLSLPRVSAAHLTTLSDLGQDLLAIPEPGRRMDALCKLMVGSLFQGAWAAVVRLPEPASGDDHEVLCRSVSPTRGPGSAEPYLSRSVLRAVRDKREPVLAGTTGMPADVQMSVVSSAMPSTTIACPLTRGADHFDLIYVSLPPQFGTGEWLALASLAAKLYQQAESTWTARKRAEEHAVVERDLTRARQIQMRLVPNDPRIPGLDVAIGFVPCRSVGGDYVDVVPTSDGRVLLVVADVCGKGLGAALVAQGLHTMMHASLLAHLSLRQTVTNLDRYLRQTLPVESFVTLIGVVLDPATGELECVNAGHPKPLVLTPYGGGEVPMPMSELSGSTVLPPATATELPCEPGLPLGIEYEEEVAISQSTHRLEPGQLLALYTDGLSELTLSAGDLLGTAGLRGVLSACFPTAQTPARDSAAALTHKLDELQSGHAATDDRTFLLARRV